MLPPRRPLSRRAMLRLSAQGLGGLALGPGFAGSALARSGPGDEDAPVPRAGHHPPRAQRVLFLYMRGGPSQVDGFDPKPRLQRDPRGRLPSPWGHRRHGESGTRVSALFPHIARVADRLCFLHGVHAGACDHAGAALRLHTGSASFLRPSLGSWIVHGRGSERRDLPGHVTLRPSRAHGGALHWSPAFLPASCRGLALDPDRPPPPARAAARLAGESAATRRLYGLDEEACADFGRQCLVARRLLASGVRFVQCTAGGWDAHADLARGHARAARAVDRPVAGLIRDLAGRGMLDDTLVLWAGEIGRSPAGNGRGGRDHQSDGFTVWMAGGGVQHGRHHGSTGEYGERAVEGRVSVSDLHATILFLLGLDHARLEWSADGGARRPCDPGARVVHEILA